MKKALLSASIGILVGLLFILLPVYAQHEHEYGVPPAPAVGEQQEEATTGPQMCSPEHMRMMLQNPADKECVAEGVLQDGPTTEIIMDKIVQNPDLRKQMMEKMHTEMHKRMMEHRRGEGGMMQQDGMMQEGGMMEDDGGMMRGEGGMMQGDGSMRQGEGAK